MANSTIINLNSLIDLSNGLYESADVDFILNSTLLSLMGKLKIFKSFVLLPNNDDFVPALNKSKLNIQPHKQFEIKEIIKIENTDDEFIVFKSIGIKLLIPLIHNSELIAVICLGESLSKNELSIEEYEYINLVSSITANAIVNARNLKQLEYAKTKVEQRNQLLSAIFDLGRDFSSFLTSEQIIKMLSLHLMGQMMVSRFAVYKIAENRRFISLINRFNFEFDNCLLENFSQTLFAQRISEFEIDNECKKIVETNDIRIISPMVVAGNTIGFLIIGKKLNGEEFDDRNLQFIQALGNTAASALENERLFQEEIEKKKLESELKFALEIQKNLLPKFVPEIEGYSLAGTTIPSRHVGGDYYDFLMLDEKHLLLVIADVSGKGMPASLIMAHFQAALRILAPLHITLTDLILKLNLTIYENTSPDKFVTAFVGILDVLSGAFYYINAGHNPPYLCNANKEIIELSDGGLILGFTDEPPMYHTGEVWLNKDDVVLMYTDGVNEAQDINKEDFGDNATKEALIEVSNQNASEIITHVVQKVKDYSKDTSQFDDITLIALKRTK